MNIVPFIPENAPFTPEQRLWLNGYLAGLFSDAGSAQQAMNGLAAAPAAPAKPLTILFGSQTGTAEGLAKKASKQAAKHGFAAKLVCMDKHDSVDWSKERHLLVITSTYGDGEPPDNAQGFWGHLKGDVASQYAHLSYSVLALGDTNYSAFCQFGINCDERFAELGANRLHPRTECDVDYEANAKAWMDGVFAALAASDPAGAASATATSEETEEETGYSKTNPFPGKLLSKKLLNAEGSAKEVRHYAISLAGSGIEYEVGDALGVYPVNCSKLVGEILAALGCDGEEAVKVSDKELSLRMALTSHFDITRPSPELLKAVAGRGGLGAEIAPLLEPSRKEDLQKFLWGREIIDLITGLGQPFAAAEFVGLLKKLQPRLYSISSSPKAHPGEVHLTIAAVRYESHGRSRKGVCSTFLADSCEEESTPLPVYIQVSHGFRLPANGDVPVIMCGPGTGIAPFRAFLEERHATGATGKNWLFFGDQKRSSDFLYQEELEAWLASGHLSRLDLAFSRDQAEKIYVQTRMLENATELWNWFQEGAHFYVCGDASRMAKDVDAALVKVAEIAGGLSAADAAAYVQKLKDEKRYQRDVY